MVARSDLILALVRAAVSGDQRMLIATTQAIIAEARSRQQHSLADRIELEISDNGSSLSNHTSLEAAAIEQHSPDVQRVDLIFPKAIWEAYDELVHENQRRDLLRSYGLEPRHRILLWGAPGTGKTSLASLLASELMVPLLRVNYSALFGSLLGETSQQLQKVLEFAAGRHCVLLLDEFDSLGKSRDDPNDSGEVKRVLNFLLVRLEQLPSHVIVVAATNRPATLDEALWRRFQKVLHLPEVSPSTLDQWISRAEQRSIAPFGIASATLKRHLTGLTFAELESAFQDIQRQYVLNSPNKTMRAIVSRRLSQRDQSGAAARKRGLSRRKKVRT
jgi:hypothetical protein